MKKQVKKKIMEMSMISLVTIFFIFAVFGIIAMIGVLQGFGFESVLEESKYVLVNSTCAGYGYVHYDNETCIECIDKIDLSLNKNNRRYMNYEKENPGFPFIDDRLNVRQCHGNN